MERDKTYNYNEILNILKGVSKNIIIKPNYGKAIPRINNKEIIVNEMNVKNVDKIIITKTDCGNVNNQKYYNVICKFLDSKNRIITYKVLNKDDSFTYKNGFCGDEFVIR